MATKKNNENVEALQKIVEALRGIYCSDIQASMDNLIAALEGSDKNNYILAARSFDYAVLYTRARMAETDSNISQFTVKVVELAKKKGWYEEPKQAAPAAETKPAEQPAPEKQAPAAKKKAKK